MNTLAQLGVAVGEAAAMCRRLGVMPREIWTGGHARELQRHIGGGFPGNPDSACVDWRIVDDEDEGVKFAGGWRETFCCNGGQFGDKVHEPTETAEKAVYPLPVEMTGRYRLLGRINYRWDVEDDSETAVAVFSGGRRVNLKWNQAVRSGEWNEIGVVELSPGASLELDVKASRGTIVADAFAISAKRHCVRGSVSESSRYEKLHPRFAKALAFMRRPDASRLPCGRYEIDGSNCWATISSASLKPFSEDNRYEVHREFIDIHVPITGSETIGVATPDPKVFESFNVEKDCVLFNAKGDLWTLDPGEFAIFFPERGAHAPGLSADGPRTIRKLVIKVRDI